MVRLAPLSVPRLLWRPGVGTLYAGAWVVGIAVLEVLGRRSPSDLGDVAGISLLLLGVAATRSRHARAPFPILVRLRARMRGAAEAMRRFTFEIGLDLRGTPPLPAGWPPLFWVVLGSSVVAGVVGLVLHDVFPTRARGLLLSVSPTLVFVATGALWMVLAIGCVIGFFLPVVLASELLVERNAERVANAARERDGALFVRVLLLMLAHAGLLVLGALFLPAWTPLALILACLVCALLCLGLVPGHHPPLLWRSHGGEGGGARPVRALDWTAYSILTVLVRGALLCALFCFACGDRIEGAQEPATGLTAFLGGAFGWSNVVAYGLFVGGRVRARVQGWRRDPSRPTRVRVGVEGESSSVSRACGILERAGLAATPEHRAGEVWVRVVEGAPQPAFDAAWPLVFAPEALARSAVLERLKRRDQILSRRAALKGIGRLFKAAARRQYARGSGFWLAPHLAFARGMSRDEDESDPLLGGVPYHPRLSMPARRHLHVVLSAAQVDILFVEDGVGGRRLKRVFLMLFEFHDLFGGKRAAEERHFTGIPGVRILIHDFDLAVEREPGRYPEPHHDRLGRARILHVFRDRGEDERRVDVPADFDFLPGPLVPRRARGAPPRVPVDPSAGRA